MTDILFSVLIVLGVLLLFLAAVLIFRATVYGRVPEPVEPVAAAMVEGGQVAEHLAAVLRIPTTPMHLEGGSPQTFEALFAELEKLYPRLHATLRCEVINEHSRLFCWPGSGEGAPLLLYAHVDVVPADPATLDAWTYPPFSGTVADDAVWGRGALDMKSTAIALMEAVENKLKAGAQPERTVYLAIGHDEETGGLNGARAIAQHLRERGETLSAVIDEGGAIMSGMVPGLALPAALVGVAEKGYMTIEMKVEGRAGHSSMPSRHTAIGVLARAITRLESAPLPARLERAMAMFQALGPFLPFSNRLAMANAGLFRGALTRRLAGAPTTNALIRTTTAVTMIQGGVKDNVLPALARAAINFRLLPGDSQDSVVEHVRRAVSDEAVQINIVEGGGWDPSPVSPADGPAFAALSRAIRQTFPDVVVAPYLVLGATDSRHFVGLTENIFRFSPYLLDAELLKTIHGVDERIGIDALAQMVAFYSRVLEEFAV